MTETIMGTCYETTLIMRPEDEDRVVRKVVDTWGLKSCWDQKRERYVSKSPAEIGDLSEVLPALSRTTIDGYVIYHGEVKHYDLSNAFNGVSPFKDLDGFGYYTKGDDMEYIGLHEPKGGPPIEDVHLDALAAANSAFEETLRVRQAQADEEIRASLASSFGDPVGALPALYDQITREASLCGKLEAVVMKAQQQLCEARRRCAEAKGVAASIERLFRPSGVHAHLPNT